ncbi:hypothetical protein D1007_33387 [Hordeum vulgare]|uniref:Uncharacterized protein n=1 Tax=Hordeum vulgare subsp. vulgare TaxID=112509 RepID=A0A8I7BIW6_HORVV|nr:hypothetical protein D1007_33387 [Hordeum vulgare]
MTVSLFSVVYEPSTCNMVVLLYMHICSHGGRYEIMKTVILHIESHRMPCLATSSIRSTYLHQKPAKDAPPCSAFPLISPQEASSSVPPIPRSFFFFEHMGPWQLGPSQRTWGRRGPSAQLPAAQIEPTDPEIERDSSSPPFRLRPAARFALACNATPRPRGRLVASLAQCGQFDLSRRPV